MACLEELAQPGMALGELNPARRRDLEALGAAVGEHRGGARPPREERDLAEEIADGEGAHANAVPSGPQRRDSEVAASHDEELVARGSSSTTVAPFSNVVRPVSR
jgi:hypothetical protein